jgi:hypothetical protein
MHAIVSHNMLHIDPSKKGTILRIDPVTIVVVIVIIACAYFAAVVDPKPQHEPEKVTVDLETKPYSPAYTICNPPRGEDQDFESVWTKQAYNSLASGCI